MSAGLVSVLRAGKLSWHVALSLSLLSALLCRLRLTSQNLTVQHDVNPHFDSPSAPSAPSASPIRINEVLGVQLHARIHELAKISAQSKSGGEGVNRPFLSQAGAQARQLLLSYMFDAGLTAYIDGAGNVLGQMSCPVTPMRRAVAMGSHFDSVRGGGKWDGVYGVLSAIAVAKVISGRAGGVCALPFDLIVVAFDDEEGNNPFGTTNFGAKAFAGVLDFSTGVPRFPQMAREYAKIFPDVVRAGNGSLEDRVAARVASAAVEPERLLAFLELHIEQGPVLERQGIPVGAVDAIAGQTRLRVTIRGNKGHAGTVPMKGRVDALAAAAEAVSAVEQVGRAEGERSLVATVGALVAEPGSTNVIPGVVRFSVDIRAPEDDVRLEAVRKILGFVKELEKKRGVRVWYEKTHEVRAVSMSKWVREVVEGVKIGRGMYWIDGCGGESGLGENCSASVGKVMRSENGRRMITLTSGAGHDTQLMSRVTDVGMLFVRCRGGLSHHVDEHVEEEDSFEGASALLEAVEGIGERVKKGKL